MKKLLMFFILACLLLNLTVLAEDYISCGIYSQEMDTTICNLLINEKGDIRSISFCFLKTEIIDGKVATCINLEKSQNESAEKFASKCLGKNLKDVLEEINNQTENLQKGNIDYWLINALKNSIGLK